MYRYFVLQKIVQLGTFSRAAEALGYTQSAVSQAMASLEKEVGFSLLRRSRTGAVLTQEGKQFYPQAEALLRQYQMTREKADEICGLRTGVIRMGTFSSISSHWLPPLFKEFQASYPDVHFVLHQGDYSLIPEWLREGSIDFGFSAPQAIKGMGLDSLPVKDGPMYAILPERHPLATYEVVPLHLLAREPFILVEEGHYFEPLEVFRAQGLRPEVKYTIHDDFSVMNMVESGLGVSIEPGLVLRHTHYRIVIRPTNPPIKRTIIIAFKDWDSLPLASRKFIRLLQERVDELPDD